MFRSFVAKSVAVTLAILVAGLAAFQPALHHWHLHDDEHPACHPHSGCHAHHCGGIEKADSHATNQVGSAHHDDCTVCRAFCLPQSPATPHVLIAGPEGRPEEVQVACPAPNSREVLLVNIRGPPTQV